MDNIIEELIDYEVKKRELENSLRLVILFKLVSKYNTFYSDKPDCSEAILLENLIEKFVSFDEVREYCACVDKINELLNYIYIDVDGEKSQYFDSSNRSIELKKKY